MTMASEEKKDKKNRRKTGYWLLAAGIVILAAGVYLFTRTLGTNLLFTPVWIGYISRFYLIFLAVGILLFWPGCRILKKYPREKKKKEKKRLKYSQDDSHTDRSVGGTKDDIKFCSGCGNQLKPGNLFCEKCGKKVE